MFLAGCKPTEKNYQQAYDAAKAKREAVAAETMVPTQGLQNDDGPQMRVIDGDTVYVDRTRLRTLEDKRPSRMWYVAVGVYKMNTNAKANAENLRNDGYSDAVALKTFSNRWYTVCGGVNSLDSAAVVAKDFKKKHAGYPYVGLPKSPVLLYNL